MTNNSRDAKGHEEYRIIRKPTPSFSGDDKERQEGEGRGRRGRESNKHPRKKTGMEEDAREEEKGGKGKIEKRRSPRTDEQTRAVRDGRHDEGPAGGTRVCRLKKAARRQGDHDAAGRGRLRSAPPWPCCCAHHWARSAGK